jgi:phosphate acetyltransferase
VTGAAGERGPARRASWPGIVAQLRARAARAARRVVFPESGDPRTLDAVRTMVADRIVAPILVLDAEQSAGHGAVRALARSLGVPLIEPGPDSALVTAMGLVRAGQADACVAGAAHTTAAVLRAALRVVGKAPGIKIVSSAFYMILTRRDGGGAEEVFTFTDCAVVPEPTADQLADIAIAAARDRARVVGDTPRVAFLSYSTYGSGGPDAPAVARVRAALALARQRAPDVLMDGELQGDAAIVAAVAERKGPAGGGAVAGHANVLVFPSLDAGNIAYKLVERLGGAVAIGPILQGLASPCADLSRGAGPDDIINAAAVTALQAASPT